MRDAHTLVAQMQSFPDAIAAGTIPTTVWRHAESRVRAELGSARDAWRAAARRAATVGGRAAEALAGWLAAILQAAADVPPLPPRERLRTLGSYRKLCPETAVSAACKDRIFSPAVMRVLGRLAGFIKIPAKTLLRHVDFGGSTEAAKLLLQQNWVPASGLDSSPLVQVCNMPHAPAKLIEDLAVRTEPDDHGLRALHRLSGEFGPRGRAARTAAAVWAAVLPREEVATVAEDTALEVRELPTEGLKNSGSELADLEALTEALTAPWLEGLRLQGQTAKRVYARRPLTADSVRVVRLATQGMELEEAERLLADVEPCLVRHDSRGVVALLDWLGGGEPRPVYVRLLHSLVQTAPVGVERQVPDTPVAPSRSGDGGVGNQHKFLPQSHSRASVEAVEFLLSACPKLARSTLPLDQLGLNAAAATNGGSAEAENGTSGNATGHAAAGAGGAAETTSAAAGLGRLLPLQTLALRCDSPDPHTALIARALLRRSPEARDHPLPRSLRRNARGSKYTVYVCNAATCLQQRRLAAEEAGQDTSLLKDLQEIFGCVASATYAGGPASSPSPRPGTPTPALAMPPASPPPRPPPNPPPPRRSPKRVGLTGLHRHPAQSHATAATTRGERTELLVRHGAQMSPEPLTLCQALAARAARGLPPLGGSPRLGGELHLRGCGVRGASPGSGLPAIRAQ